MKLENMADQPEFNPLSSLVCRRVVFEKLGFDPKMRGVNGSTKEDCLMLLLAYGEAKKSPIMGIFNCVKKPHYGIV